MSKFSEQITKLRLLLEKKSETIDFDVELQKLIDSGVKYKDLVTGISFSKAQKEKDNLEALDTLEKINNGEIKEVTPEIKEKLKKYTGAGGTSVGSDDEYYTPDYVAKAMWNILELPKGAKVLDPSSGTGIFGQNKPKNIDLQAIEINKTTAQINGILTDKEVENAPFEVASKNIPDNSLDAVITNVPFGKRDKSLDTSSYFKDVSSLEDYFVLKSLMKLKYGGKAMFIMPTGFVDNKNRDRIKKKILNYGSFLGAIRLPNKIFSHTGANVATDIVVFEKHPENVINSIRQGLIINGTLKSVVYGNDINRQFLNGNYFKQSGKKNVIGVYVDSETFMASPLYDNYTKGTQVLTADDIETIKDKIFQKAKQKFHNTTEYNNLVISGGYNIASDEAMAVINKSDVYVDYFQNVVTKERITQKDLKEFRKQFLELNNKENNQVLYSKGVMKYTKMIDLIMAINYGKDDIKKSLSMFNAIQIVRTINKKQKVDKKDSVKLGKYSDKLKELFSKKNTPLLKCSSKEIKYYAEYYNEDISQKLSNLRLTLTSLWDIENEKVMEKGEIPPLKTLEFGAIVHFYKKKVKIEEKGYKRIVYLDPKDLDPETILDNKDIAIIDNKLVKFESITEYGRPYKEVKTQIENIEFSDSYGLTKEQFDEKKSNMLEYLATFKSSVSVDKLFITKDNVDMLIPDDVLGIVNEYANKMAINIIQKKAFQTKKLKDDDFRNLNDNYSISSFRKKKDDYYNSTFYGIDEETSNKIKNIILDKKLLGNVENINNINLFTIPLTDEIYTAIKPTIGEYKTQLLKDFNIKLDLFCKQNPIIRKAIIDNFEEKSKIGLSNELTSKSARIHSLKEFMSDEWVDKMHGYQNEDVNKFSTTLSGVIASQTGLGKSLSSFSTAIKSLQSGEVKKVLFVVPNGVFDKWRMEVTTGRKDSEGNQLVAPYLKNSDLVMFLDKKEYHSDYQKFIKNKDKRILFITYDQLANFSFKNETINILRGDTKKDIEANNGEIEYEAYIPEFDTKDWVNVSKTNRSIGYFEDGQFDLVLYDEAQYIKNSTSGGTQYKFASSVNNSVMGDKARVVSAYLEYKHHKPNGTILVTATPFTNTPYEIYTALRKIGGLKDMFKIHMFEEMFMSIEKQTLPMATNPDEEKQVKVFTGLKNIDLLEKLGGLDLISYRTAEKEADREVNNIDKTNLKPDEEKSEIGVPANEDMKNTRQTLLEEYENAKEYLKNENDNATQPHKLESYFYGKSTKDIRKLGSAFSLLSKIDNLSISDEFAKGYVSLDVSNVGGKELKTLLSWIEKATITIDEWEEKIIKGETEEVKVKTKYKLSDLADKKDVEIYDNQTKTLTIPTTDSKILSQVLNKLGDVKGLFDIEKYPKYKALFQNIHKEIEENNKVKQLIFTLKLNGALILERLAKDFYDSLEIVPHLIMTTLKLDEAKDEKKDTKDDSGQLSKFQEKFNNSNIATILIFTKKTSTGVDFNKNTKAIHIVDIPYTPDVLEQAKGRAIRQGNPIKKVNLYLYQTNGTFDDVKTEILSSKNAWQNDLLSTIGTGVSSIDNIAIDKEIIAEAISKFGVDFTKEQLHSLIQEKKDKQSEEIKRQQEIKKQVVMETLQDLSKQYQKASALNINSVSIKQLLELEEPDYNETSNTYKMKTKKDVMNKFKLIQKNTSKVISYILIKRVFDDVKLSDNLTKENIIELFNIKFNENKSWNIREFKETYKEMLSDKITIGNSYNTSEETDNPLNKAKKEVLKFNFEKELDNQIDIILKKINSLITSKEQLQNTLSTFKELASNENDDADVANTEKILSNENITIFNGYRIMEISSKRYLGVRYDKHNNNTKFYQTIKRILPNDIDLYISMYLLNENVSINENNYYPVVEINNNANVVCLINQNDYEEIYNELDNYRLANGEAHSEKINQTYSNLKNKQVEDLKFYDDNSKKQILDIINKKD